MAVYPINWQNVNSVQARVYSCWSCGASVAPVQGWFAIHRAAGGGPAVAQIYLCHNCHAPTFFDPQGRQFPGVPFGDDVKDITDPGVASLYEEARRAISSSCHTAAVLCCRKILMHVAVAKGAKPGDTFASYVEHFSTQGYIPPDAKGWVDHIRSKSNEANHEIKLMSSDDAQELLSFTAMLLKLVFEYPEAMKKKVALKNP